MARKRTMIGVAALTALAALTAPVSKLPKMAPYSVADYQSEANRKASAHGPVEGLHGRLITIEEHVKTARDLLLFTINDFLDTKPEYDIKVDKSTNEMEVYLNGTLVRKIRVGTGQVLKTDKPAFGEYVTPNGDYIVIHVRDKDSVHKKFGKNAHFYGDGMIQMSGPWAPHIALHGTNDNNRIGKYTTNGCINMRNEDILWLMRNAGIGSRIHVYQSQQSSTN